MRSRFLTAAALLVVFLASCTKQARRDRALHRANDYFASGKYDNAQVEYLNVLRLDPAFPIAYQRLGFMWFESGAPLRAAPFLLKARALVPNDLETRRRLARTYLAVGRRGDAFSEAMKMLEQAPNDSDAAVTAAEAAKNNEELARVDQVIAAMQPQNMAGVQLALATAAVRHGNRDAARQAIEKALTADPKSAPAHAFMGTVRLADKDIRAAREEFKTAAELSPPRSVYRLRYAQFQMNSGDIDGAATTLREVSAAAPDYLPAWLLMSEISLGKKEYDESLRFLANILNRDPENIDANIWQARTLVAKGDADKAIQGLERLDTKYPNFPPLKYELARCYVQKNNANQAITLLNQALSATPDYFDAALLRGQLQLRTGKPKDVVEGMRPLVEKHPELPAARLLLADAYRALGQLDDAAAIFRDQLKASPDNAEAHLALGIILRQQKNNVEARQELERARQLAPANPLPLIQLVDIDLGERDFDGAHRLVQDQLKATPNVALAHFLEGKIWATEGKWDPAEASLTKALSLNPNFGDAYTLLASVYAASNKIADAARQLEIVAARTPNNPRTLMSLAVLYEKLGDFDKAAERYEKLLEITPEFAPALNNLAYLYIQQLHQPDRAYQLAQKARALQPGDSSIADTLGWVLYKKRDYKQAIPLFTEAVTKTPNDPEIQYHLGMCYYMMGNTDAARAAFEQALKSNAEFPDKVEAQRRFTLLTKAQPEVALTIQDLESSVRAEPDDVLARMSLGAKYESATRYRDAANQYEEVVKLNPRFVAAFVRLAELYNEALNDPGKALSYAKSARELSPGDVKVTLLLGRVALRVGNYSWAYSLLKQGCEQQPDDAAGVHALGWAAFSLGKTAEATQQMQRVVQIAGDSTLAADAKTWLSMMQVATEGATTPSAADEVSRVLQKDANYAPAQLAQATISEKQGESGRAALLYEQVLNHYPDYAPAQKRLAMIYAGRPAELTKAYDLATKARKNLSDDLELTRLTADICYERKDYGRAVELLEEAARKEPLDARHLYLMGVSLLRVNNVAQGKEALNHALASGLQDPLATEARRTLQEIK